MFTPTNPKIDELKSDINEVCRILNELYDAESEAENTEYDIDRLKDRISEINSEISALEKERKQTAREIAEKKKLLGERSLKKIREEYSLANEKKEKINADIQKLIDEDFKKFILTINDENSIVKYLSNTTKTTPIMDEFYNDKTKDFLILNGVFYGNGTYGIIVTRDQRVTSKKVDAPTMTELKTFSNGYLHRYGNGKLVDYCYAPARMKPLLEELDKHELLKMKDGDIVVFDEPLPLGGQTYANQTGYGWEWDWSGGYGDYTEGTYYGEVTSFLMVGILYKKW